MIKKCEELLEYLEEAHALALEIQQETGTHNLDTLNIEQAQQAVRARIQYLKATAKLEKEDALKEKAAAEQKAKAEAEEKAKADAEQKAKEEAEAKAKAGANGNIGNPPPPPAT